MAAPKWNSAEIIDNLYQSKIAINKAIAWDCLPMSLIKISDKIQENHESLLWIINERKKSLIFYILENM